MCAYYTFVLYCISVDYVYAFSYIYIYVEYMLYAFIRIYSSIQIITHFCVFFFFRSFVRCVCTHFQCDRNIWKSIWVCLAFGWVYVALLLSAIYAMLMLLPHIYNVYIYIWFATVVVFFTSWAYLRRKSNVCAFT